MTPAETADRAADLLYRSRMDGTTLRDLPPDLVPVTIEDAYAVQDATLRRMGSVGGWKVAAKPDSEPRCAILPASVYFRSGATLDVPPQGLDIEVETAFVLGRDLAEGPEPLTEADVAAAIGAVHLAFEMCASRFADKRALSPLTPIADMQANAAVILGAPETDWRSLPLESLELTLTIDGAAQDLPRRNAGLAETMPVLAWLANHARSRGAGLRKGHAIITGARLGPVPLGAATGIVATCPGLPEVRATFRKHDIGGE